MSGSAASRAKTSLLRAWEDAMGYEASNRASFTSLLDWLTNAAPDFLWSKTCRVFSARTKDEISELYSGRWPSSGIISHGVCLTANTLASPNHASASTLLGVIETGVLPRRYFLSPNAARGCLRRADRMGRRLFPPFRQALSILAQKEQ